MMRKFLIVALGLLAGAVDSAMVAESARNPKLKSSMYELHLKIHDHVMQNIKAKIARIFTPHFLAGQGD